MHEQSTQFHELAARLDRVERRYRRLVHSAIAIAAILAGTGLLTAQFGPDENIPPQLLDGTFPDADEGRVVGREFMLFDEEGNQRASLVADTAGSVFLTMLDTESNLRAALSVMNRGPALTFYDPDGQVRTVLGSTPLVGSHVVDADGNLERNPPSSIVLFDSEGNLLWREP